jgi:hypothetical protein
VVGPETVLGINELQEYAPTATDIPPPYTIAPFEWEFKTFASKGIEEVSPPDVNEDAVQLVNVLLEMV